MSDISQAISDHNRSGENTVYKIFLEQALREGLDFLNQQGEGFQNKQTAFLAAYDNYKPGLNNNTLGGKTASDMQAELFVAANAANTLVNNLEIPKGMEKVAAEKIQEVMRDFWKDSRLDETGASIEARMTLKAIEINEQLRDPDHGMFTPRHQAGPAVGM